MPMFSAQWWPTKLGSIRAIRVRTMRSQVFQTGFELFTHRGLKLSIAYQVANSKKQRSNGEL